MAKHAKGPYSGSDEQNFSGRNQSQYSEQQSFSSQDQPQYSQPQGNSGHGQQGYSQPGHAQPGYTQQPGYQNANAGQGAYQAQPQAAPSGQAAYRQAQAARANGANSGQQTHGDQGVYSGQDQGAYSAQPADQSQGYFAGQQQNFPPLESQIPYVNDIDALQPQSYSTSGERLVRVKHRRHKHRGLKIAACIVAVLVVVCGAYGVALANSAMNLKSQASTAMNQVSAVQSSIEKRDFSSANSAARQLQSAAAQMDQDLSSPLWTVASVLPVVGSDVQGVRTIASALSDASTSALVPLTNTLQQTNMDNLVSDGTIDIASLSTLLAAIEDAAPAMRTCTEKVSALPDMNIPQLQQVVSPAKEKLTTVNDTFQAAAALAPVASNLLGANGDRTYLLVAQNTAELRASGGFPGSVGTLTISNGHISLGSFTTVYDMLNEDTSSSITLTDEEKTLFYGYTRYSWDNGFNPDFARVGSIWAASYNDRNNAHVDGVISLTPSVVQKLLASLNTSITLTDGTKLDGSNATKVLEHDLYWKYLSNEKVVSSGGNDITDALFSEAAGLAFEKVLNNFDSTMLTKLSSVLMESSADREVMAWMSDSSEQNAMETIGCSGSLDSSTQQQPTVGAFMNIWTGSKLGWWFGLDTSIGSVQTSADGTRTYHVTTTVSNYLTSEEISKGGTYIMSDMDLSNGYNPFVYIYAPAGGSIENLTASNGAQFSTTTYKGLQVLYTAKVNSDFNYAYPSFQVANGSNVTISYDVVLPASVEGDLQQTQVPTLQQYR